MLRNAVYCAHIRRRYAGAFVRWYSPTSTLSSTSQGSSSSSSSNSSKISETLAAAQASNERDRAEKGTLFPTIYPFYHNMMNYNP